MFVPEHEPRGPQRELRDRSRGSQPAIIGTFIFLALFGFRLAAALALAAHRRSEVSKTCAVLENAETHNAQCVESERTSSPEVAAGSDSSIFFAFFIPSD